MSILIKLDALAVTAGLLCLHGVLAPNLSSIVLAVAVLLRGRRLRRRDRDEGGPSNLGATP